MDARRTRLGWALMLICSLVTIHVQPSAADEILTLDQLTTQPTPEFAKGTWIIDGFGSWATQPHGTPNQLWSGAAGINDYVADNFSMGWEFTGYFVPQKYLDATGAGGALAFRYHILHGQNWSIYSDLTLGLAEFDHKVPEPTVTEALGGTDFNFTLSAGGGATFRISDRTDLMLGLRYFHLSNAGFEGIHRNPSVNATEGYVGLMFKL